MLNISVIVTVYNLEKYIRNCLDSILNQKGTEYEVICVDDASTDGSGAILEEYEKKDCRVKVIRLLENRGLASARNEGYRHAVGEYLYNIDGDDLLVENAVSRMYGCAKENDLDLLGFSARAFFDNEDAHRFGNENDYVRKHDYPRVYQGPEVVAELISNGDRANANRVLYCYKRSFFIENGLYDEEGLRYADDSMFSYYVTARRAMCIPDQLYLRRYREGSIVTSPLKKRYLESMAVLFCVEMERWRKMKFSPEVNWQIEKYFDRRLKEIGNLQEMFQEDGTEETYLESHPADSYFYKRFIKQEPRYIDCLSQMQLNRIRQAKALILYGAGYM
ncbi:MAG: glycosyltransferase, partial [Lachnospiraceae bacterium]|nr:glycosyltransferase [Lachnospiraceae bacterium]